MGKNICFKKCCSVCIKLRLNEQRPLLFLLIHSFFSWLICVDIMGQNSLERTIHIFYMCFQKIGSGPTFIMIQNCDMKTNKGKKEYIFSRNFSFIPLCVRVGHFPGNGGIKTNWIFMPFAEELDLGRTPWTRIGISLRSVWSFKGQLISEFLFGVCNFPKNQRKNLMNVWSRI